MLSVLSFDSRLLKALLDSKNSKFFDHSISLIFKMRLSSKDDGSVVWSSIDRALENNQIQGLNIMIDYMI
jgi:hypothetical protein